MEIDLDEIERFPIARQFEHCGRAIAVSPFDIYATCPVCSARVKLRAFGGIGTEIQDVFDAGFHWMLQPGADAVAQQRLQHIRDNS